MSNRPHPKLRQHLHLAIICAATFTVQVTVPGCTPAPNSTNSTTQRPDQRPESRPPLLSTQTDKPIETTVSPSLSSSASLSSSDRDNILPTVSPLAVKGDLLIAGSNAMTPLVEAVAERFVEEGFAGELSIERTGSQKGFEVFCQEGKSDIAIASRAMTESERQTCAASNRQPVELAVGTDMLAIVVGKDNTFVTDITQPELSQIFTAEYWSEVRPNWPQQLIRRTLPEPGSGALQLFVSKVFDGRLAPLLQTPNSDFFSEDEDYLVQALSIDPYAIAFFSYTYYESNKDALKLVSIDGTGPSSREQYPFIRTLYLYADANTIKQRPQIGDFLTFFLTHSAEELSSLGYFSLPQARLKETKTTLRTLINDSMREKLTE